MNDINSSFGKGSVTRLGSAGGALVYVLLISLSYHITANVDYLKTLLVLQ